MIKIGWFAVRDLSEEAVQAELRRLSESLPLKCVPDDFLISPCSPWVSVVLGGWEFEHVHRWAQLISLTRKTTTVSFFALDGLWEWRLFHRGTRLAGMEPRTAARVFLFGDIAEAASLLGVEPALFKAYCRTYYVPERFQGLIARLMGRDIGGSSRAVPGDSYSPYEEWAQLDFARHLGITYPEPEGASEFSVKHEKASGLGDRGWPPMPAFQEPSRSRIWPRPTWIERFHPRTWT